METLETDVKIRLTLKKYRETYYVYEEYDGNLIKKYELKEPEIEEFIRNLRNQGYSISVFCV